MKSKSIGQPKKCIAGHYSPAMKDTNEVWGLAIFPNGNLYASASDDGTIRIYDSQQRK
jgi:WD40 repeat protein